MKLIGAVVGVLLLLALGGSLMPDRTKDMTCEDLRLSNVTLAGSDPYTAEVAKQVIENNRAARDKDCSWPTDGKSGPSAWDVNR